MSDFNYYYAFYDKSRGEGILDSLRQGNDKIKAEAIDYLIDRGYLHSEEVYNSAYVNAMGDYLGISEYGDDEDEDEFEAPVARGTKHSSLDEVHQRLREAGKKRRQQLIAQARRMKKEKFDAEGIVKMKIEYEWFCDFYDDEENRRYKDYGGLSQDDRMKIEDLVQKEIESHIASGEYEGYYPYSKIGWSNDEGSYEIGYTFAVVSDGNPEVIFEGHHGHHHAAEMTLSDLAWITRQNRKIEEAAKNPRKNERIIGKYMEELEEYINTRMKEAEMEMTPDIMDYPGLPVVPDSYGTNSALDSGNGVPQWYGSAETFEAPFAGAGSLFKFGGNDSALGGFTAKELTESSAIHGDFDHAALNYSGHQNIEARAEGYGDMSRYIQIDYTWDYQGEHEEAVSDSDYYITDRIHELVEQEVHNGEYSGNGYYTYTVEYENDKGETIEEDVDIDFSWG